MWEQRADDAVPATIPIQQALWSVPEGAPSGVLIWAGWKRGMAPPAGRRDNVGTAPTVNSDLTGKEA